MNANVLRSMSPCELMVLSLVVAYALCKDRDADTLNVLGNFIVAVGGLVLTWAAQTEYRKNSGTSNGAAWPCMPNAGDKAADAAAANREV